MIAVKRDVYNEYVFYYYYYYYYSFETNLCLNGKVAEKNMNST